MLTPVSWPIFIFLCDVFEEQQWNNKEHLSDNNSMGSECTRSGECIRKQLLRWKWQWLNYPRKKILERVGREVERASQRERRKSRATWWQAWVPHRQPFAWCNPRNWKVCLGVTAAVEGSQGFKCSYPIVTQQQLARRWGDENLLGRSLISLLTHTSFHGPGQVS